MTTIRNIHVPWRDDLQPASFRGALFHVEAGAKESGRRIVVHEFPKRELPYSEDMGRRAMQFSVRGYCITFPLDTGIPLYGRDYRIARDALIDQLETEGVGVLQLPTLSPFTVVCPRYQWSEEEGTGGYCVFDMTFVEAGTSPSTPQLSSSNNLKAASLNMKGRVLTVMTGLEAKLQVTAASTPRLILPQPSP
jgi:prophage DNA circulation protein